MKKEWLSGDSLRLDLTGSVRRPSFWLYTSWLELGTRYRASPVGVAWLVIPTAVFVTLLGNVYAHLMGYDSKEYIPYLATGYILWRFALQCITESAAIFHGNRAFIMEGGVRLTDFLVKCVAKALIQFAFAFLVALIAMVWSRGVAGAISVLSIVLTLPIFVVNVGWISVVFSLAGARLQDTREIIGAVVIAGFLLTPILWTVDRFPPESLRGLLARLNPAFHLIEFVRAPALGSLPEPATFVVVGGMTVTGLLLASVLYRRYARFVPLWL